MEGRTIWGLAADGHLEELERRVGQDPGLLDAQSFVGTTPLMYASESGHVAVVRWLVDKGAAINVRANGGRTALFKACDQRHVPVVGLLLESGADPSIGDDDGITPLTHVSYCGHPQLHSSQLEVVRVLLGHPSGKATVNQRMWQGHTALWIACCRGKWEIARALLENGADPTIAPTYDFWAFGPPGFGDRGTTPAVTAVRYDHPECVAVLKVRSLLSNRSSNQLAEAWGVVLGHGGRRRSGPTFCTRPGR
jgi:ankyrin repeat protein